MADGTPSTIDTLHRALPHLSAELQRDLQTVFERHLSTVAGALERTGRKGPSDRPAPHLAAETTPSPAAIWQPFRAWWQDHRTDPQMLAQALSRAGVGGVLLLMGQRTTPASLTDTRAVPPTRSVLLASAQVPMAEGLTVAARAWTKHAARSADPWWGAPTGAVAQKNEGAHQLVVRILDATTWWNVFGHPVHEAVLETRMATGHGARWSIDGNTFVGFLDPFEDRT